MPAESIKSKHKHPVTHALIMAAGYGTRLEPLTLAIPKPMVPVVNKPTMLHNLELLKRYGFKKIICNIHYSPEQIEDYFYDGKEFGVSLFYSYEESLLGTAGGVLRMAREIGHVNKTFLVLSSDALTDINLKDLIAYHKKNKALATITLTSVDDPSHFGVVVLDKKNNRVTAFQEKPKKKEALSNLVNTGIYVFEPEILRMIPKGSFYDFGRELFPRLVKEKKRILGYKIKGYWSDVGGISAYKKANLDAMQGKIKLDISGEKTGKSIWVGKEAKISKSARLEGGVVIGKHALIEDGVRLENAVIGDRCVISKRSKIKDSIIWSDTIILSSADIVDSIVGNFCYIGKETSLNSSVIGNCCHLRNSIDIPAGSAIKPGTDLL